MNNLFIAKLIKFSILIGSRTDYITKLIFLYFSLLITIESYFKFNNSKLLRSNNCSMINMLQLLDKQCLEQLVNQGHLYGGNLTYHFKCTLIILLYFYKIYNI